MIKINTISNNKSWKKYLKNPNSFIQNRISELKLGLDKTNEINSDEINKLTNIIFTHDQLLLIEADVLFIAE